MRNTLSKKDVELIKIDESFLETNTIPDKLFREVEINKIKRLNIYHWVVHIIAFLIIIPYLGLILFGQYIPESYTTIVSVVVGFYFAKSLFN